jgi:hypothetical protein
VRSGAFDGPWGAGKTVGERTNAASDRNQTKDNDGICLEIRELRRVDDQSIAICSSKKVTMKKRIVLTRALLTCPIFPVALGCWAQGRG